MNFLFDQVVSDKQLVKQLQKEVARLEAELRTPELSGSSCSEALLKEKELKIKKVTGRRKVDIFKMLVSGGCNQASCMEQLIWIKLIFYGGKQMEMEMEELKRERDFAHSQLVELRKKVKEDHHVSI